MYNRIKHILKGLIPKSILFKYELIFRFILYQFYRGKNFQCNICKKELRLFIHIDNDDKLCPYCGSLSRNRRLFSILDSVFLKNGLRILDFSPSRCLYRVLKNNSDISYESTDLSGDFLSDHKYDITSIDSHDNIYDLVICYHILEHIEKDYQAIQELYRVLKHNGICIIQTPFKNDKIYEDFTIKSEIDSLKHFEQKDHVRIYSVLGLKERLTSCGFHVEIKEYHEVEKNKFGYHKNECVLICRK